MQKLLAYYLNKKIYFKEVILYKKITLENLLNGVSEEKFQTELKKVKENIADINTDWKKPREINIKISLQTDEKRETVKCEVSAASKLIATKETLGFLKILQKDGLIEIFQDTSTQKELFDNLDVEEEDKREVSIKDVINQ